MLGKPQRLTCAFALINPKFALYKFFDLKTRQCLVVFLDAFGLAPFDLKNCVFSFTRKNVKSDKPKRDF